MITRSQAEQARVMSVNEPTHVEQLVPALARAFGITEIQASKLYTAKLQRALLPLDCVFHMRLPGNVTMQPLVHRKDLERVVTAARGVIVAPTDAEAARLAPAAASTSKRRNREEAEAAATDNNPLVLHKRARLEAVRLSAEICTQQFQNVLTALQNYTDTVEAVEAAHGLEAVAKDALLARCRAALAESAAGAPAEADGPHDSKVVVVSHLVREHLGYYPAEGARELCVAIGRAARKHMVTKLNRVPTKRTYIDDKGEERESNNYFPQDAYWLQPLVRAECERLKHYPRPSVALARGEPVHIHGKAPGGTSDESEPED